MALVEARTEVKMGIARMIGQKIGKEIADRYQNENKQIKDLLAQLSDTDRLYYEQQLEARKKSLSTAYVFWCLGGTHYLYLQQWAKHAIFWGTMGGVLVWYVLDFFFMFFVVDAYNRGVSFDILNDIMARAEKRENPSDESAFVLKVPEDNSIRPSPVA